jgi:predicted RNase H-like HicB family nuclease
MALDAMEGLIEVMIEKGEAIPESDTPEAVSRFYHLAHAGLTRDEFLTVL